MSATSLLFQLQKIDSQRDKALARLRAIEAELEDDSSIRAAKEQIESLKNALLEETRLLTKLEAQLDATSARVKSDQSAMYDGHIQSSKELGRLELEVASQKSRLEQLEDQSLQAMTHQESLRSDLMAAEAELERLTLEKSEHDAALQQEKAHLSSILSTLAEQSSLLTQKIPPATLEVYQRLRHQKGGVAVALIEDKACAACGASLTQTEWEQAHHAEGLVYCRACGRILSLG